MSEKISEEMARKVFEQELSDFLDGLRWWPDPTMRDVAHFIFNACLKVLKECDRRYLKPAAGLLEPEEDPLEKARREWAQAQDARGYSEQRIRSAANVYIRELEARLKASEWTEALVDEYARYRLEAYKEGRPFGLARDWHTQRRDGKGAE